MIETVNPAQSLAPGNRKGIAPVIVIAVLFGVAHMLTNGQYGFHRDEWQFLSDAQHLDWGFVPYPPLTAALEFLGLKMFGLSLVGLRLFSVLAQVLLIIASGLMARDLGGGRLAQVFAALSVAPSPLPTTTLIVLGDSRKRADELFTGCRLAGHNTNALGIANEESQDHPDIFVCGPTRKPWSELWKHGPAFG